MAGGLTRSQRVAGHFGELLQGRLGPDGPVALVTLPCPALAIRCDWRPGPFALRQIGPAVIGQRAALALLRRLGLPARAAFRLSGALPPGGGAGASTAARVAFARAAAEAAGLPVPEAPALARACVASEGASDPLMYPEPARLLWGSRAGRVLATLPPPPPLEVIGGFFGPARRTDPRDHDFPDIADLAEAWPRAVSDARAAARLASESARRVLGHRHKGLADPTEALADRLGALGFAIAHTGSARALLFRPGEVPAAATAALRKAGFQQVTRFRAGGSACSPAR
ncbi:propanediol utilization protein [Amaricoccus sp. W119]|uniref:GHMP family kinase ATP-binding protein n=1 Tax=Amaricoccus sp. W119 TaxID=3391833 RepID=UPI0039A4C311